MARIQMALHHRDGVTHQAECHQAVRRALMFDDDVDIALFSYGLQRVEDIAVVSAQIFFDKTAGGQAPRRTFRRPLPLPTRDRNPTISRLFQLDCGVSIPTFSEKTRSHV